MACPGGLDAERRTSRTISLAERLDTAASEDLLRQLSGIAEAGLVLDAGRVGMLGGRCLEVLLNIRHRRSGAGKSLTLCNVSGAMAEDLACYGVAVADLQTGGRT